MDDIKKGSLIMWVAGHKSYQSDGDVLIGLDPIYKYGIIMEVSYKDTDYLAVASFEDGSWHVVDLKSDEITILSEGAGG